MRSLEVSDMRTVTAGNRNTIVVDLINDDTKENEATVAISLTSYQLAVTVNGFVVASFELDR